MEEYHESMGLTRQFTFCPNAFRIDLYRNCTFGCKYCFANMEVFNEQEITKWRDANIDKIKNKFKLALETDVESKDIIVELLRHRVPLHCGGMSDPFQPREWQMRLTYELIKLSNQYQYPIQFSTKTSHLPDMYYEILDPKLHMFQVSIMGLHNEFIRKWETNTPTAYERLEFVKKLRDKGFWVGIRIQPIIDIQEVLELIHYIKGVPNYYTVEHFKLIYDTDSAKEAFIQLMPHKQDFAVINHKIQVKRDIKIKNIQQIINTANLYGVKVGVGDNDLHYMSQSRCCCGIDLGPDTFKNYLKYNVTYMSTGDIENDVFIPKMNPRKNINDQKYGLVIDCKQYVDDYIKRHLDYMGEKKKYYEKLLTGRVTTKLF